MIKSLRLYKPDGGMLEFTVGHFAISPKKSPGYQIDHRSRIGDEESEMEILEISSIELGGNTFFHVKYDNGFSAEFNGFPYAILYE